MARHTATERTELPNRRINTDACPQDEYGGSMQECVAYIRENAPDSELDAAPVAVDVDTLPTGHNY